MKQNPDETHKEDLNEKSYEIPLQKVLDLINEEENHMILMLESENK